MSSLLLKGGLVLDLDLPLARADVMIEDNLIVSVQPSLDAAVDRVVDVSGRIVMPGLINSHSHSHQALFKGLVDNLPLELWHPAAEAASAPLSPRELYVSAAIGAIEMLTTGTTSVLDNVAAGWPDFMGAAQAAVQAYVDAGMRAAVAPHYEDMPPSASLPLFLLGEPSGWHETEGPRYTAATLEPALRTFLASYRSHHRRITPMLSPASPTACSQELLEMLAGLAAEYGVALHAHLLETKGERLSEVRTMGGSPVDFLGRIGFLGRRTSFAHCVWVDDWDMDLLAATGCVVVHNPISNLKLGSGIAPVQALRSRGIPVGLGADDASCNDSHNMFEVMKGTGLVHKLYGDPHRWPSARDVLEMCWRGGACALGQPVGAVKPGCLADLIVLRSDRLYVSEKDHLMYQLVYSENGASVETVVVDGALVVERGKVQTLDAETLYEEARAIVARAYERVDGQQAQPSGAEALIRRLLCVVREYPLPFDRLAALR